MAVEIEETLEWGQPGSYWNDNQEVWGQGTLPGSPVALSSQCREPGMDPWSENYSLGGSMVKNPPAIQETRVRLLGQQDLPEKDMATRSNILTWRIPWTEEPGRLQYMGSQRVRDDLVTNDNKELDLACFN